MKNVFKTFLLSLLFMVGCGGDDDGSPPTTGGGFGGDGFGGTASYSLTFETNFSEEAFPNDYPANALFGPILVVTHSPEISIFNVGQLASDGLKAYVEDGDVGALSAFISSEIGEENEGLFVLSTTSAIGAEASTTVDVTVTEERTRITFMARLDPSPDWFVGVSSFDVVNGDELVDIETVNLSPLDAGTTSGSTYEAPEGQETANISIYQGLPFANGPFAGTIASLVIERSDN